MRAKTLPVFFHFFHYPMLRSSVVGSSQDQVSLSNSATRFNSTTQTSGPSQDQSCAESLHRGADESREDIRQGEFLSQVSPFLASATPSQASCLESGFSVIRKAICICRLGLENDDLLLAEEDSALRDKLEALERVDTVKDAYALLKNVKKRCAGGADRRAMGGDKTLFFTLEEIEELTRLQLALQANHGALLGLSRVVDRAQKRLESVPHTLSGARPIRLLSETPAHQLLERFTVIFDGSVEEIPHLYSGLQFWCEFFEARDGRASLSVMLFKDFEDIASLTELDVVQGGINALEEDRQWRAARSREKKEHWPKGL